MFRWSGGGGCSFNKFCVKQRKTNFSQVLKLQCIAEGGNILQSLLLVCTPLKNNVRYCQILMLVVQTAKKWKKLSYVAMTAERFVLLIRMATVQSIV